MYLSIKTKNWIEGRNQILRITALTHIFQSENPYPHQQWPSRDNFLLRTNFLPQILQVIAPGNFIVILHMGLCKNAYCKIKRHRNRKAAILYYIKQKKILKFLYSYGRVRKKDYEKSDLYF